MLHTHTQKHAKHAEHTHTHTQTHRTHVSLVVMVFDSQLKGAGFDTLSSQPNLVVTHEQRAPSQNGSLITSICFISKLLWIKDLISVVTLYSSHMLCNVILYITHESFE